MAETSLFEISTIAMELQDIITFRQLVYITPQTILTPRRITGFKKNKQFIFMSLQEDI